MCASFQGKQTAIEFFLDCQCFKTELFKSAAGFFVNRAHTK